MPGENDQVGGRKSSRVKASDISAPPTAAPSAPAPTTAASSLPLSSTTQSSSSTAAAVAGTTSSSSSSNGPRLSAVDANATSPFHHIFIDGDDGDKDYLKSAEMIAKIMLCRERYQQVQHGTSEDNVGHDLHASFLPEVVTDGNASSMFPMRQGIFHFDSMVTKLVPWSQYIADIKVVIGGYENGPCLSVARSRLTTLTEKFELYSRLNSEMEEESIFVRREAYGAAASPTSETSSMSRPKMVRVDNAVRVGTFVTAPTMVEFLSDPETLSSTAPFWEDPETHEVLNLRSTMERLHMSNPEEITVDGLGLHPPLYRNRFQPFDVFNPDLNPAGKNSSELLNALVSLQAPNKGTLLADLIRPVLQRAEFVDDRILATELEITVHGSDPEEWFHTAHWIEHQAFNHLNRNSWVVDIPRRDHLRSSFRCETHADVFRNIFYPMFMATVSPFDPKYAEIAATLKKVGVVKVSPETNGRQRNFMTELTPPEQIPWSETVDDYYFFYFVWANLTTLNALRQRLGLNTFLFRIACVEPAPAFDHLVTSYLLADSVQHALSLSKSWILQYLFLMSRVGVIMSPLCDNALRLSFFDHPFASFFKQGLLVSLATTDPLHFHHSSNPLNEEYATTTKLAGLTTMDQNEIARNSVLISGFSTSNKQQWLGEEYQLIGSHGNNEHLTSVCDARLQFRHECLWHEQSLLNLMLLQSAKKGQPPPMTMSKIPQLSSTDRAQQLRQLRHSRRTNGIDRRVTYPRIEIYGGRQHSAQKFTGAVEALRKVVALRKKYTHVQVVDVNVEDVFSNQGDFDASIWEYNNYYGVFLLSRIGKPPPWPAFIPPVKEFIADVTAIRQAVVGNSALIQLASHRLELLGHKFLLHLSLNVGKEAGKMSEKEFNNRDFFTARKVDNNVQTESGMNARTLLDFFVEKAMYHGDDVVFDEDNSPVTLRQLLNRLQTNANRVTVDELNHLLKADPRVFDIFLSTDNFMKGRYFAELTKRTLDLYHLDEYTFAENRLRIHGKSNREWWDLAAWFDRYGMASSQNRWMVNLPRNYRKLKQTGVVKNFGEFLDNIFQPLWAISLHPASDTKFHYFLAHVSGFDCFDDESKVDLPLSSMYPHDWNTDLNPPYNLYLYYYWANIVSLNDFRASRGLGRFTFRPQCGEHGGIDHLIGAFLVANSINHGVTLHKCAPLEYMYYLSQIGITMSPLSNTRDASPYLKNPFPLFFHRGLQVSLSTNQPLYFHFTREPLIEEYSIAAKLWKFEFNDLSEIARNSVLQSGFPPTWKAHALGSLYDLRSTLGNEVAKTRLADIRVAYRFEVYHSEVSFLDDLLPNGVKMPRAFRFLDEECALYESVTGTRVVLPSLAGEEDDEDSASMRRMRLETELTILAREMSQFKVQELHLSQVNVSLADEIERIRERLRTLPLTVCGNLKEPPPMRPSSAN